jgi:hypothetical protein
MQSIKIYIADICALREGNSQNKEFDESKYIKIEKPQNK